MCPDSTLLDSVTHKYSGSPAHSPHSCARRTNQAVMPRHSLLAATLHTVERDKLTARSPAEHFSASAWPVKHRLCQLHVDEHG